MTQISEPDQAEQDTLPDGVTSRLVREYTSGSYRYSDLGHAIAERDRQRNGK